MSHQAVTWSYEQDVTPSGAKFVLVTLANYANGDGYCYPGQKTLAEDTGLSDRAVRGHLDRLEAAGLIFRQHRYNKHGKRTSDGCWLVGFKPLPEDIAGSLPEESAASDELLPEDIAPTTGNYCSDYRKNLPVLLKEEPSEEEPSEEPREKNAATPPNAHYVLYEQCCRLNGGDPKANPDPSKQLKVFSRMLKKYGYEPVSQAMAGMAGDDFWRRTGFDAFNVEKHIDKYLMRGDSLPDKPPSIDDIKDPFMRALLRDAERTEASNGQREHVDDETWRDEIRLAESWQLGPGGGSDG